MDTFLSLPTYKCLADFNAMISFSTDFVNRSYNLSQLTNQNSWNDIHAFRHWKINFLSFLVANKRSISTLLFYQLLSVSRVLESSHRSLEQFDEHSEPYLVCEQSPTLFFPSLVDSKNLEPNVHSPYPKH
ncbi:hypothetical protein ACJIZ3_009247 [Penstemon smallii]|uniref:Uncharacterized protein n=1 Tax=Penstemon smallii TaxID=265156 RepID=A0ABD3TD21_9LAMI